MAGFHLTRRGPDAAARLAAAEARFRSHGFTQFEPIATAAHQGFHVHYIHGGPETFFRRGGDFVAVAGTLSYRDRLGREALAGLLDDGRLGAGVDHHDLLGVPGV